MSIFFIYLLPYLLPSLLKAAVPNSENVLLDLFKYSLIANTCRVVVPKQGVFTSKLHILTDFMQTHSAVEHFHVEYGINLDKHGFSPAEPAQWLVKLLVVNLAEKVTLIVVFFS